MLYFTFFNYEVGHVALWRKVGHNEVRWTEIYKKKKRKKKKVAYKQIGRVLQYLL